MNPPLSRFIFDENRAPRGWVRMKHNNTTTTTTQQHNTININQNATIRLMVVVHFVAHTLTIGSASGAN